MKDSKAAVRPDQNMCAWPHPKPSPAARAAALLGTSPLGAVVGFVLLAGLFIVAERNFLLFHVLGEMFSIAVASATFLLAWNIRDYLRNNYLMMLGVGYLFVAGFDTLHTVAYKGMGVFPDHGANLPTQLWIAARSLETVVLLAAPMLLRRKANPRILLAACIAASLLLAWLIFTGRFPVCYVEGEGLTPFKRAAEYAVCLLLAVAGYLLYRERKTFDPLTARLLMLSMAVTIVSELCFTLYISVYGSFNIIGHFAKILSFYLVYKAIIETGLRRPYAVLFQDLQRKQADLVRAKERSEKSSRAKGEFLAHLSHEVKNPLNGVLGMLQLLKTTGLDEKQLEYAAAARQSAFVMLELLSNVLDFSKIEAGRLDITPAPFEPREVIGSAVTIFSQQAAGKGIDLLLDIDDRLPDKIMADPGRLRQILLNLIGNAVKFTDQGAVRVFARYEETRPHAGVLTLEVSDTGVGMDTAQLGAIFEPYAQVDESSSRRAEGAGLGLAIVRRLVDLMAGSIDVDSQPGRGTRFTVSLPVEAPPRGSVPDQDARQAREWPAAKRPLKVLIVDDNRVNRLFATRLLEKIGHHPSSAQDGRQALDLLAAEPFDAVLMDLQMPEMDGLDATRRLRRSNGLNNDVAVLAMTAHHAENHDEALRQAGVSGELSKPLSPEELYEALERLSAPPRPRDDSPDGEDG